MDTRTKAGDEVVERMVSLSKRELCRKTSYM